MGKNREIGILRGIAICAVVAIHTFSIATTNVTTGIASWMYQIFHNLIQFAVPCFIFISAILLSYPLQDKKLDLNKFYIKKVYRIVIPYILWSLFYLVFKIIVKQMAVSDLFKWQNWVFWFTLGKAYTHLYYLSIILQLYLFTPLLLALVQGIQKLFKKYDYIAIIVIAIASEAGIYLLNKHVIYQHFKYHSTLMIWYIYLILIGIWVGFNYERFKAGLKKYISLIWVLFGINMVVYIGYVVLKVKKISFNTMWYQFNWFTYAMFTILVLLWICLLIKEKNMENPIIHTIEILGDYSFGIYLMHPVITFILRKFIHVTQPLLILVILMVAYVLMMLICIGIIKILRINKWTNVIIGEYRLWKLPNKNIYENTV
ncbi:MAG: acyltransferase [Cellulosilyticum sp.]|nr:acyltransferase [Cellulosilyticum sp.]